MKIKQLLPILAAAIMLSPAVFADAPAPDPTPTTSATQELTLTVSEFINIWVKASNPTAALTPNGAYTSFTIPTALSVDYGVLTNKKDDHVYLKASTGSSLKALKSATDGLTMRIAFVNTNATTGTPDQTAVDKALSKDADKGSHANVIALDIDASYSPSMGGVAPVVTTKDDGHTVDYKIGAGTYDFLYTTKTTDTDSLSTHDEFGTYKATLLLSHSET